MISAHHEQVFAYTRNLGDITALILLNFTEGEVDFSLKSLDVPEGFKFVLGNYPSEDSLNLTSGNVFLKGYEGKVYIKSI